MIYPAYGPCDCLTKREIQHIRAHYAGEVTLVDIWMGRPFQKIENLGLFENTIVDSQLTTAFITENIT
ncbi:MAG: hypothetical protein ACP5JO_05580 [Candidatus Ratteibacteria bacterium]